MKDYIARATAFEGVVIASAAVTTNMTQKAHDIHNTSPEASAALGRTMTAAALMSSSFKNARDKMTIQIKGGGPLGSIVVSADANCNVKGYVFNPGISLPLNEKGKLDVGGVVGNNGYLNIIKDFGLKSPYTGYVDLVSGEIAEDLAMYFLKSEQIHSAVNLSVLVGNDKNIISSGGFIIQLMPGAQESTISFLEDKINSLPALSTLLSDNKLPEDILELIFGKENLNFTDKKDCAFSCNCSRERMERNLISIGRSELNDLIKDQGEAELQCHFCNNKYLFSKDELEDILAHLNG